MADAVRQVIDGDKTQAVGEEVVYSINTVPFGTALTILDVYVFDTADLETDLETTMMPTGSHSVAAGVVTLKPLIGVEAGKKYKVVVEFQTAAQPRISGFFVVKGVAR